jgi:hypothetical protein
MTFTEFRLVWPARGYRCAAGQQIWELRAVRERAAAMLRLTAAAAYGAEDIPLKSMIRLTPGLILIRGGNRRFEMIMLGRNDGARIGSV